MIFGISGTKRTARNREVSVRRGQTVLFSRLIDLEAIVPSLPQQVLHCCADAVTKLEYSRCVLPQGPEEMCLSLEHQNPSKTSEKMGYFDRVTVSLDIPQNANQETKGSQDRLTVQKACPFFYSALRASVALRGTCRAPARYGLR